VNLTSRARIWGLTATGLLLVLWAGLASSNQRQQVAPNRDQMRKILAQGHENRVKWRATKDEAVKDALEADLRPILGQARRGLQEIPADRGDQVRFSRVVLNGTGAGFDAVRFRTPATGEEFNLIWEIVVPGNDYTRNLQGWNIVGVDAPGPVTDEFSRRDSFYLPGAGLPDQNYCITPYVRGRPLRPDSEYILWFDLVRSDQTTPAFVKVRLTTAGEITTPQMTGVQKARGTFQTAFRSLNQRYDAELKGLRKSYLAELDKAGKAAAQQKDTPEADRIVAEADEILRGESETAGRRGFRILRAHYGVDERWADVTEELRPLIRGNVLRFDLGTDVTFKADPAYGTLKRLVIVYSLDGNTGVSITTEKQRVELPPTAPILDRIPPVGSSKP
jgi:hypothetical protein